MTQKPKANANLAAKHKTDGLPEQVPSRRDAPKPVVSPTRATGRRGGPAAFAYFMPTLLVLFTLAMWWFAVFATRGQPASSGEELAEARIEMRQVRAELSAVKTELQNAVAALKGLDKVEAALANLKNEIKDKETPEKLLSAVKDLLTKAEGSAKKLEKTQKDMELPLKNFDENIAALRNGLTEVRNVMDQMKRGAAPTNTMLVVFHSSTGLDAGKYVEAIGDLFNRQTFRQQAGNYRLGLLTLTTEEPQVKVPLTEEGAHPPREAGLQFTPPSNGSSDRPEALAKVLTPAFFQDAKGRRRCVVLINAAAAPPPEGLDKTIELDAVLIGTPDQAPHLAAWVKFCSQRHGAVVLVNCDYRNPSAEAKAELKYHLRRLVHPQYVRNN